MDHYAYKCDCDIIRNHVDYGGMALLIDCDGDTIFVVPDTWSDDQIWTALDIANSYYSKGRKVGKAIMQCDIKRVLDINT